MKQGILFKSTTFHINPYWVVKCNENILGSKNCELPIDPLSLNRHPWWFVLGRQVSFEILDIGGSAHAHIL